MSKSMVVTICQNVPLWGKSSFFDRGVLGGRGDNEDAVIDDASGWTISLCTTH
jgi:hypothetical protein